MYIKTCIKNVMQQQKIENSEELYFCKILKFKSVIVRIAIKNNWLQQNIPPIIFLAKSDINKRISFDFKYEIHIIRVQKIDATSMKHDIKKQ